MNKIELLCLFDFIRKDCKITLLKTFEINRLSNTKFEYKPVFIDKPLVINESVRRVNNEKFREIHEAVYDEAEDIYQSAMTQNELQKKYGYFFHPQNFMRMG